MERPRIITFFVRAISAVLTAIPMTLIMIGCAASSKLPAGTEILSRNRIVFDAVRDPSYPFPGDLSSYVRQQPASFSFAGSKPVAFNRSLVNPSVENIKNHLDYLGYYGSTVEACVEKKKRDRVEVTYLVRPGKCYKIDEVIYELPEDEQFRKDFYADTSNVTVRPGTLLSESALEAESERSAAYFRTVGYFGFTKNYYFFEADTLGERVSLRMCINEYTRNDSPDAAAPFRKYYIDSVSISYPATVRFREKLLKQMNTIIPGSMYNEKDVKTTYNRLSALKVFNSVGIGMTKSAPDSVDCDITLTQARLQGVKLNLEASSNSMGLMGVSPQLSYIHKNIFGGGEWLNLGFMGNFQFKFNDNVRSNEFGVSAGISFPRFLGLPYRFFRESTVPRTDVQISYNYQERPEYTRSIVSTSFGYTATFRNRLSYQLYPLQMNIVHLYNVDPVFNETLFRNPFMRYAYQNHFDAGVGGTLYFATNTDVNPSETYRYIRFNFDLSGNVISLFRPLMRTNAEGTALIGDLPFSQYVKAELMLGKTWRFGKENSQGFAVRLLAGAGSAYGNSAMMPFEKQFYSGGASSLRGWQARSVGPGGEGINRSFIIPSQTGDVKLEANLEYRFGLFWKLAGAVFVDAGNVWTINRDRANWAASDFRIDSFYKTVAANWGIGARCDLGFIVIRVDMGMKIHDPSRPEGTRWLSPGMWLSKDGCAFHFGVGYPF